MARRIGGNHVPPPVLQMDLPDLVQQMKRLTPYYTPEWRFNPDEPDPGTALFYLFAEMFLENVKRFNQLPFKHFVSFLNMIDLSRQTAKPAVAYLTFRLSEGAKSTVYIPPATQAVAKGDNGRDIVFETASGLLVSPARLTTIVNASYSSDLICPVPDVNAQTTDERPDEPAFRLFHYDETLSMQQHAWWIGHSDMFLTKGALQVDIEVENGGARYMEPVMAAKLANPDLVEWLYSSGGEWKHFDDVRAFGRTVSLIKRKPGIVDQTHVQRQTSRWIVCRTKPNKIEQLAGSYGDMAFDSVTVKVRSLDTEEVGGLLPDQLYNNDVQLGKEAFYPFGEQFVPYSVFYAASDEALSKKGAEVTVTFTLRSVPHRVYPETKPNIEWKLIMKESQLKQPEPTEVSIIRVIWEYWNGDTWARLYAGDEHENVFYRLPQSESKQVTMRFLCPDDLTEAPVNGETNRWIRARIMRIEDVLSTNAVYLSPYMENIRFRYDYGHRWQSPDFQATANNMDELIWPGKQLAQEPFKPFYPMLCKQPAVYFGFDEAPVKGPIGLYVSLLQQPYTDRQMPAVEWEYYGKPGGTTGWHHLKVNDDTAGFTRSGTVQFAGPPHYVKAAMFGTTGYWLRAVNRDGKFEASYAGLPLPAVKGIYMNTARVVQQESIKGEYADKLEQAGGTVYSLSRFPIIEERIWVDETGHITEPEIAALAAEDEEQVETIRDTDGNVQRCWVLWQAVNDLAGSGSADRHYRMERSTGKLTFGDGKQGKLPPAAGRDKVKADYKIGGGQAGNVPARLIVSLQHAIAFVQEVFNPEPAGGGCDMESVQEAIQRGPQSVKHRDRAVTAEDFEWLTRQADANIGKVKCLPGRNARMEPERGCIAIVVLPKSMRSGGAFPLLKRGLEQYLLERAASSVSFPGQIAVVEPAYIEVSVTAELVVKSMEHVVEVELETAEKLEKFLDPFAGGFDGQGWDIGQHVHTSVFYSLLKTIAKVNHIGQLSLTLHKVENERRIEISQEQFERMRHGMMVSGNHHLSVNAL